MIKHCKVCDNEIPRGNMSTTNKKYQAKKYCCNKCHHADMKQEFKYKCADCSETVIRKKDNITTNVFCNDVCKGRYAGKHYSGLNKKVKKVKEEKVIKLCCHCENEYTVVAYRKDSKFCSMECRAKHNAKLNLENKINRVTVSCCQCNNDITRRVSSINNLNFCNLKCMLKYYSENKLFSGENSGTWNGGKKTYYGDNWLSQRRTARNRDNHTCQKCGISEEKYGHELSVHHIIPFVFFENYLEANQIDNLISVCEPCHRKIHSGDNHPSKFFKKSVDDIV